MRRLSPAYIFILPGLLLFLFLVFAPLLIEVIIGLSESKAGQAGFLNVQFTGFKNIIILLGDENYLRSLQNTFIFLVVNINVKMALALGAALAFNRKFVGKRVALSLLVIPWALPEISYYLTWRFLYHPEYGFFTYLFDSVFGIPSPNWLGDSSIALYSVMITHVIKYMPFWTLIFLAGLQSIPVDLYDAAKVDGASSFSTFRYITLPMLKNIIIINYTLSFVWMTGEFNSVWLVTQGGPNYASHLIGTYAYIKTFLLQELNLGMASFIIILPILIVLITVVLRTGMLKLGGD
jgi:ABC-type sugar transport system permease subunit